MFSVTLSVALRPPVFHWHPLLRSPDFPPSVSKERLPPFPEFLKHFYYLVALSLAEERRRRGLVATEELSTASLSCQ